MKKLIIAMAITLLAVTAVAFANGGSVTVPAAFQQSTVDAFNTGSNADYLAGMHIKEGFDCTDCQSDNAVPTDERKAVNESCYSGHADLHGMAELSAAKFTDREINAHESHLTNISCSTCHTGHVASYP